MKATSTRSLLSRLPIDRESASQRSKFLSFATVLYAVSAAAGILWNFTGGGPESNHYLVIAVVLGLTGLVAFATAAFAFKNHIITHYLTSGSLPTPAVKLHEERQAWWKVFTKHFYHVLAQSTFTCLFVTVVLFYAAEVSPSVIRNYALVLLYLAPLASILRALLRSPAWPIAEESKAQNPSSTAGSGRS